MMKKLLIVGSTGFLGSSLIKNLSDGPFSIEYTSRSTLDLGKPISNSFIEFLDNKTFSYVVICAAIADVEKCYADQEYSEQVNVKGMIELLKIIKENGAIPIFFSTDYVLSGKNTPYKENEIRNPLTTYGKQKQAVEEYIESNFTEYLIFRTSKLMSKTAVAKNILYPVIQNLIDEKESFLFEDQLLNPIFVEDIAKVLVVAIERKLTGFFHLGTDRVFTRAGLGRFLAISLGYNVELIKGIYMKNIKFSEARPTNNLIDCKKIKEASGFIFCEIEEAITELKKMSENLGY